jgi:hypothetical protein
MQLGRHAIVGVSIPTNKNTPIITGTLHVKGKVDLFRLAHEDILLRRHTTRTRYVSGIREYFNRLFVGFCLQAINDKQYHARDLLGALLYRCLASRLSIPK